MITMGIVWVLDVKRVAFELSGSYAKVELPQADNDSRNSPENFQKKVFLTKSFEWNILYSYRKLFKKPFLNVLMHTRRQNI